MTLITVTLYDPINGRDVYSLTCTQFKSNTEANRCKALDSCYKVAASRGVNVAACAHKFN